MGLAAWALWNLVVVQGDSGLWLERGACRETCAEIQRCAGEVGRADLGRTLCHIAACESGKLCGRKEIRSPSGKFRGPLQFVSGTWRSVCGPLLRRRGLAKRCGGPKGIYDTCCNAMCAADVIALKKNGGLRNWPHCGPAALRAVASEK